MSLQPRRVEGLTLAEIAARAGLSVMTIYNRYTAGDRSLAAIARPRDKRGPKGPRPPDALDEAIWCERLGDGGPTATQAQIATRFGVTRQAVSLREVAMRGEGEQ